ncbi:uncharacterized protein LOC123398969 [Hordeum vulgare subsp. vulgare]|uniref:uncharacterized protein LOC123398969 n=1 Tax=Hordeum vulgare subsp. vulgare TaxID=112509 RepID=UPI001D1A34D2|nr:uncharacterized protein LOC123398969 [Hordeum vulgare subsp. vulgare]
MLERRTKRGPATVSICSSTAADGGRLASDFWNPEWMNVGGHYLLLQMQAWSHGRGRLPLNVCHGTLPPLQHNLLLVFNYYHRKEQGWMKQSVMLVMPDQEWMVI